MTEQNEPKFKVGDTLVIKAKVLELSPTGNDTTIVHLDMGLTQRGYHTNTAVAMLDSQAIQQAEVIPAPYRPKVGEKFCFYQSDFNVQCVCIYADEQGVLYEYMGNRTWAVWEDEMSPKPID